MAAAEYFTNAPMHSNPSTPYSNPPRPQRTGSGPAWINQAPTSQPQQQYAPPPYQAMPPEQKPNVHFAPMPGSPPQRHSFSGQQRPSFSTTPPQNSYARPHQGSWSGSTPPIFPGPPTSRPGPQMQYGTPPQQNGYLAAPTPPHMKQYQQPQHESGYASDPEPRRRRRKHRDRHHSDASREVRDIKEHSRSTNSDAFLGAAGGGLIGDLIFPGLGTLGGAALGWIGGKDYGNHRKWREDKRERDQRDWEGKYGQQHRGHSHDRHRDDKDRKHSYERSNSHY